ncbi:MAG TPA: hypothetical protein VK544_09225 [Gemmatimonadaceae bacterium]|nr:hypothetical protein [Gemmatimonadaceae bacterium]
MPTRIPLLLAAIVFLASCERTNDHTVPSASSTTPVAAASAETLKPDTGRVNPKTPKADGFDAGGGYRVMLRHGLDKTDSATLEVELVREAAPDSVLKVATLRKTADNARVLRADTTWIVLTQESDYGYGDPMKLFLDPKTKKLIKSVPFSREEGLDVFDDTTAARMLNVPVELIPGLKEREARPKPDQPWDAVLPKVLRDHPIPQPTYSEFARARPGRVEDGYDSAGTDIGEFPGPVQVVGDRVWFGKRFYDGEGLTGIGGVGYFDTTTSKYTFLDIPEIVGWSVSAILVQDKDLWIGLVGHPEGADYGGGLLLHDLQTGKTTKYDVKQDVVLAIRRLNNATYLATPTGLLVMKDGQITDRYLVEPKIDETFDLIHLPGRP